jgi:hypothetical protein
MPHNQITFGNVSIVFGVLGQATTVVHHGMRPCRAELTLCVGRCPDMMLAKSTPPSHGRIVCG